MRVKNSPPPKEHCNFYKVFYSRVSVYNLAKQRKGGPPLFEERYTLTTTFLFQLFIIQYSSAYATSLFIKYTPLALSCILKSIFQQGKLGPPPFQMRQGFAISLRIALDWFIVI